MFFISTQFTLKKGTMWEQFNCMIYPVRYIQIKKWKIDKNVS